MPDRTITARSARYRARAKERGLVEVRVRVPKGREQEIRDAAAEMRREGQEDESDG
jgi:hypothetical protein